MSETFTASVQGKTLACPVCGHDRVSTKKFHVVGTLPQIFNAEWMGERGIMVICANCSFIRQFADQSVVDLT
jgi:transcription elongation factor Elf1